MTDDSGVSLVNLATLAPAGTIFNMLDKYGISWENYVSSFPTGATPELYALNDTVPELLHHKSLSSFFTDAAAGKLPSFSLLDPSYATQSQENPQNIVVGEALISQVVQAIGASPLWRGTLLVLMYDEHGGYFLDLSALAAGKPTFPSLPPLAAPGNTPAALACSTTGPGTIPPPGSITG